MRLAAFPDDKLEIVVSAAALGQAPIEGTRTLPTGFSGLK